VTISIFEISGVKSVVVRTDQEEIKEFSKYTS